MSQYDSRSVIEVAESNLREGPNNVSSAQAIYQNTLLDWVDDVTMGNMESDTANAARDEIVKLWLGYASLNRKSNLVSRCNCLLTIFYLLLFGMVDFVCRRCDG